MGLLGSFRDRVEKATTAGCHLSSQLGSLKNAQQSAGCWVRKPAPGPLRGLWVRWLVAPVKVDLKWVNLTLSTGLFTWYQASLSLFLLVAGFQKEESGGKL